MAKVLSLKDQWPELVASLPDGFDVNGTARALGAFIRSWEVKDPATLLRLALAYGGCGMSLRQTCAWAAETGLARLSDPALLMAAGRKACRRSLACTGPSHALGGQTWQDAEPEEPASSQLCFAPDRTAGQRLSGLARRRIVPLEMAN